ncbi:MAG: methyltransferase domain-containing protein [Lawsonibacter sp.]|nr:methyltransferase domain-containing protein [Lawsonibacter sp.]
MEKRRRGGREQLGPYTLAWPAGVFPLGSDALALGDFASLRPGWRVCDLGTGSGALLLLLARRADALYLTGVEQDPLSARTARENLAQNGLPGEILLGDLRELPLPAGQFDLVISNPPYFPVGSGTSGGPARSEMFCTLEQLCACAARLTRNGGRFALCHRPERLADVICALRAHHLEPKRMKLASHSPDHPPSLLLMEAVRQGRPGLTVDTAVSL